MLQLHPVILPAMVLIPSIDILNGKCVRLLKGNYDAVTEYDEDPVRVAEQFQADGAHRIHVVDLNAARGDGNNRNSIRNIRNVFSGTLEVGGGIRSDDDVEQLKDQGVDRMVVGTVLAADPDRVAAWISSHGPDFIGGIDSRDGLVRVSGWEENSGVRDTELAKIAAEINIISIVFTAIDRDGTLSGPDIESTQRIADASNLPVILSGGISGMADLEKVSEQNTGSIFGVIAGKAIYEGKIDLAAALSRYNDSEAEVIW